MKRIFTALFVAAASYVASADLLYWMIDQSNSDPAIEFSYARIVAVSDTTGETQYLTIGDNGSQYLAANGVNGQTEPYVGTATGVTHTDLSGLSSTDYSFFIELYSMATGQEVKVGQSEIAAYSQLTASIYEQGLGLPSLEKAWNPTITNVPEPTSGVLMLFGLAALGLRRRRALGC